MTDYRQHVAEDVRRIVLATLAREPDATLNEAMISRALDGHGHRKASAYVRDQIEWLARHGCVAISEFGDIMIARLLPKGLDHAERRALVPGIAKPPLDL
jgi:hypothetical protein